MRLEPLNRLIAQFRKLPGVGLKSATRYAYSILEKSEEEVEELIDSINEAKANIHFCSQCGDYSVEDICERCKSRDNSKICIVKESKDIEIIEKTGVYDGVFHILGNTLDFQKGIGIEALRINELMPRLKGVSEVVIATNSDISGEMTANYLAQVIKPLGITVTRLASGIPLGSELEYVDEVTLGRAFVERKKL